MGLGIALVLLTVLEIASADPHVNSFLLFVTLTGLVFVGPWWRAWRVLRYVFWGVLGAGGLYIVIGGLVYALFAVLDWLGVAAPLAWLKSWGIN